MSSARLSEDERQIEALMTIYIHGARIGSSDHMRPIFHDLATICGHVGPDLFAQPIAGFYD
jgi:hypothetical protein